MNQLHAVPLDDDPRVLVLRRAMAQARYDHAAMRRRTVVLVAFAPLLSLLLAAEVVSGQVFLLALSLTVVLLAYWL